ncbi:hypothetical protein GQR58_017161 [Nymphon striatum]|nr:hypothetical protein GQR58_017161 [Nymphon striatum]
MADTLPRMNWDAPQLAPAFKMFKQRCELYFKIKNITGEMAVTHILLAIGEEGLRRYNTWSLSEEDKKSPEIIWQMFGEQIEPPNDNFRISRLKLSSLKQMPSESLDDFITRAKAIALKCDFTRPELDERLIELIICSTPITEFQKELLHKPKTFKLEETLSMGRIFEATVAQMKELQLMENPVVAAMKKKTKPYPKTPDQHHPRTTSRGPCDNCGTNHQPRRCPAYNDSCHYCGNKGHWQKMCRKFKQSKEYSHYHATHQPKKNIQELSEDTQTSEYFDYEPITFNVILNPNQCLAEPKNEAFVQVDIFIKKRQHKLELKVDTGAQANTLPLRTFRKMFPEQLKNNYPVKSCLSPTSAILTAYNGTQIPCHGIIKLPISFKDSQWTHSEFYVVDVPGPPILGLQSCTILNVVKLNCAANLSANNVTLSSIDDLKNLFPNQFDHIGEFKTQHKLSLDPHIPPYISPPRKTPIALKNKIKSELDTMVTQEVIRRIEEPTEWVSSLVYVTKRNGSLRICLDPRHLNKALIRPYHHIPTVEEFNYKLSGAKFFTKLDAKAGYWSVKLHPNSQKLTTFQTPFGRYCFMQNQLADGLSRLPNPAEQSEMNFNTRVDYFRFSAEKITELSEHAKRDPIFNLLKETIVAGWPNRLSELPKEIRSYWHYRDQLSIDDGLVLKGQQVIIPASFQNAILQKLHTAHLGSDKTKLLAKECVYWNNINADIDNLVKSCAVCQEHQKSQMPEPLLPHEIPLRPWSVLGMDLFELNQQKYLIVADYYSKYPIVRKLPVTAPSNTIISILKELFAEHGIPNKVVSDNGPHFASHAFTQFAEVWNFDHQTTSPRRPQGNGFIERHVQTVKNLMKKAIQSGNDVALTLLYWRCTPISTKLGTPAELLMGRKIRHPILPKIQTNFENENIIDQLLQRQSKQKFYYDQKALKHDLPPLTPGQKVYTQNPDTTLWNSATVINQTDDPRSYILKNPNELIFRRNRQQIRPAISPQKTVQYTPPAPLISPTIPNDSYNIPTSTIPCTEHVASSEPISNDNQIMKTRSGRVIQKPVRYANQ